MSVREKVRNWVSENRDPTSISADIFPAIDIDFVRKKHKPREQGEEDGAINLPSANAMTKSATEIGLLGEFQQYQQEFVRKFNQQQLAYTERVQKITQSWDVEAIRNEENEKLNEIVAQAITDAAELDSQRMTLIGRAAEFLSFREMNGLMGRLPDSRDLGISLIILTLFYVLELIVTFFLTREAGDALTVLLVALVYCTLNCAFPWALASFCRPIYCDWTQAVSKITGLALSGIVVALGIAMNLMMGHYRGVSMELAREAASTDVDNLEATQALMDRMLGIGEETLVRLVESTINLGEPQAFMLAGFGMLCFLVSWYDGLVRDDKYPGYGRQQKLYSEAYDNYDLELEGVTERLLEAQRHHVAHIRVHKDNLVTSIERVPLIVQASQGLTASCRNALGTLQTHLQQLVAEYRMANQSKRTESSPNYFESPVELTPLELREPAFPPIDDQLAERLIVILDEFAGELHSQYAEILNKLEDGPAVLRGAENLRCHPLTVEAKNG